ncbi:MAG TPA: DNA repair protein RadC [Candidatus Woesebacteria bacterium]|nr:DNA repair protein RadC [Candidatus Woesebacteria bacterium]HNS95207.1 DNA repair protein RadC [Candidatus Woesebacteria bacterium]
MSEVRNSNATHKGAGHRKRLRDRFLRSGLSGFHDYEIVELLLTLGTPLKDCKQMAKNAIMEFKGLRGVLDASIEDLQRIKGIGPSNVFGIKLSQAVTERLFKEHLPSKLCLRTLNAVVQYLQKWIGREKKEHFVALYLDSHNQLIENRTISIGILNASLVHPRELFEPAVRLHSASIIVAHNHPSGNVEPSSEDRDLTKRLVETGKIMGIEIQDHIIVSHSEHFSFQQQLII